MLQKDVTITKQDVSDLKIEIRIIKTLKRGMTGEEVKGLQQILAQDSTVYPEGMVTGYFGQKTEDAVKRFQQKNGIEAVGIVGPKTRNLVNTTVPKSQKLESLTSAKVSDNTTSGGLKDTRSLETVTVCHHASETQRFTQMINISALNAHLSHGDTKDACANSVPPPPSKPGTSTTTPRIILHEVTKMGDGIRVDYEKNFVTCAHMVTSNFQLLSTQNYFCGNQKNGGIGWEVVELTTATQLADLKISVGQQVKLCHGNDSNICSNIVTVNGSTVSSPPPTYPIVPTPPIPTPGTLLRVVGTYGASDVKGSFCYNTPGTITVNIPESSVPVVLSLVSYGATKWVVSAHPNANISKIILGGYYPQSVTGANVPVERHTFYNYDKFSPGSSSQGAFTDSRSSDGTIYHWSGQAQCANESGQVPTEYRSYLTPNYDYFYAYKEGTSEYTQLVTKLKALTGLSLSSFTSAYDFSTVTLPPLSSSSPLPFDPTATRKPLSCTSGVDCVQFWTKANEEARTCKAFANTEEYTILEKRIITCTDGRCVSPRFYWIFGDMAIDEDRPSHLGADKTIERVECRGKCTNFLGFPTQNSSGIFQLSNSI